MGCFTVSRSKKKRMDRVPPVKNTNRHGMVPTVLPEPRISARTLQSAPPSFNARAKYGEPVNVSIIGLRTLSAPSSFKNTEQDALQEEQDESQHRIRVSKSPSPQPLPLPSSLKSVGCFKSRSGPLPLPSIGSLRQFSYEDIANACQNFSPKQCISEGPSSTIFKACFFDNALKIEASVTRLHSSSLGIKDFVKEMNTLTSLQHPNLCKLLGFYARDGSDQRMLVYERLSHGSLDRLLYGRSDSPPLDWNCRVKIALCAAKGLAFLHEEGPFQAMYSEFSTVNIQIDKDFSAKLSGYGCVNASTVERGLLTPKSNVWSFGMIVLELLMGRRNSDCPNQEKNLVKWALPLLSDNSRHLLIIDPQLKGRFPVKALRAAAELTQSCLQSDPLGRPTMRSVVEQLVAVQDLKYSYPLKEPRLISGRQVSRSPSFNRTVVPVRRLSLSQSPLRPRLSVSPRLPLDLVLSPPGCSFLSLEEPDQYGFRKSQSTTLRRASVEGF